MTKLAQIQQILGVEPDGKWGPKSQAALDGLVGRGTEAPPTLHQVHASSFADPADIVAFKKCKATGRTDEQCFEVGDNGKGYWGDDTTDLNQLYVALHADHLRDRWGSVDKGRHVLVSVTANGKTMLCKVGDLCGVHDRIDLAPGAQFAFGLMPPFLVPATWHWV